MAAAPDQFLNRALLRHLAGEQLFASGEQCYALGRVRQIRAAKEKVSARVAGNPTRRVKLWRRSGKLFFQCDCEAGRAEQFCKHCVAVGLAWLSQSEGPTSTTVAESRADASADKKDAATRENERRRLASHLKTLDANRLAKLVLEATDYDEILRRRLLLETIGVVRTRAARPRSGRNETEPDFAAYQQILQEAIRPNGYVDFHAMADFVQGIEEAIAPLNELLRDGWHDAVVGLTEFALVELDAASDRVDTGDGMLNRVYDELQRLHLDACRAGPPRSMELASRLLHYELEGGLGIFNNAFRTYEEVLGPVGQAVWRTLLIDEWQQTIGNGADIKTDESGRPAMDHRLFQVQMLMERMARDSGDIEALIALKKADLQGVHDYVALAELLAGAGRLGEAIACAEEARQQFPNSPEKLVWRGFLVTAYAQAGRADDAISLAWDQFREACELEAWRELKALVMRHEPTAWPEWSERALDQVRKQLGPTQQRNADAAESLGTDQSRVVELLIEENLYDNAWLTASAGGCREDLWLRLGMLREREHPDEALTIYQRHINRLLSGRTLGNYHEALALLDRMRSLSAEHQRGAAFDKYRAALRSAHRQKRSFIRLLDTAGF